MANSALIKEFEEMLGKENVFSSEADRRTYAYDAAVLNPVVPAFVIRPTTTEQLGKCVVKLYNEGIPMTVRGAGTNLVASTVPEGGLILDVSNIHRILQESQPALQHHKVCSNHL